MLKFYKRDLAVISIPLCIVFLLGTIIFLLPGVFTHKPINIITVAVFGYFTVLSLWAAIFLQHNTDDEKRGKNTNLIVPATAISGYCFTIMYIIVKLLPFLIQNMHIYMVRIIAMLGILPLIGIFLILNILTNIIYILFLITTKEKNTKNIFAGSLIYMPGIILSFVMSFIFFISVKSGNFF